MVVLLCCAAMLTECAGTSVLARFKEATTYARIQAESFEELTAAFPANIISEWQAVLDAWMENPSADVEDPFNEHRASCE